MPAAFYYKLHLTFEKFYRERDPPSPTYKRYSLKIEIHYYFIQYIFVPELQSLHVSKKFLAIPPFVQGFKGLDSRATSHVGAHVPPLT